MRVSARERETQLETINLNEMTDRLEHPRRSDGVLMSGQWVERHRGAAIGPRPGFERSLVRMWKAMAEYADAHQAAYESPIGDDGVLGEAFKDIARGLRALLNGEAGRLDCGTLEGAMLDMCAGVKAGLEP